MSERSFTETPDHVQAPTHRSLRLSGPPPVSSSNLLLMVHAALPLALPPGSCAERISSSCATRVHPPASLARMPRLRCKKAASVCCSTWALRLRMRMRRATYTARKTPKLPRVQRARMSSAAASHSRSACSTSASDGLSSARAVAARAFDAATRARQQMATRMHACVPHKVQRSTSALRREREHVWQRGALHVCVRRVARSVPAARGQNT